MPIKRVKDAMYGGKNTRMKKIGKFYTVSLLWVLSRDRYYIRIDDGQYKEGWWSSGYMTKKKAKELYDELNTVKKIKKTWIKKR